jgi:hypothetical protein
MRAAKNLTRSLDRKVFELSNQFVRDHDVNKEEIK